MYSKGLGAFIHYATTDHVLYTYTDTGMCSTITEGKTQEAKLFTWNPKAGMPVRAIEPKRQEMEKENLCSVLRSLPLLVTVTQWPCNHGTSTRVHYL